MWIPYLKPNGLVVFHDYDPVERGGLVHFGVKICVDTIRQAGFLDKPKHKYKLFYGKVGNPNNASVKIEECWQTFENLEQHIFSILNSDYSDRILVADDRFSLFITGCIQKHLKTMLPHEVSEPDPKYLVSGHPVALPLSLLEARNIPHENITVLDSVTACCLLEKGLRENFDYLYKITDNPATFARWCELLSMLDKGYGKVSFYDRIYGIAPPANLSELSKLIRGCSSG